MYMEHAVVLQNLTGNMTENETVAVALSCELCPDTLVPDAVVEDGYGSSFTCAEAAAWVASSEGQGFCSTDRLAAALVIASFEVRCCIPPEDFKMFANTSNTSNGTEVPDGVEIDTHTVPVLEVTTEPGVVLVNLTGNMTENETVAVALSCELCPDTLVLDAVVEDGYGSSFTCVE